MHWLSRLGFLRRAWRYRLRSERFALSFLLSRDLRGRTVVDAGANQGIYSYWMSRQVGPGGRVVAFEPQPELAAHLVDLRRSFGFEQLEVVPQGLSAEDGQFVLHRPREFWAGAYLADGRTDSQVVDRIDVPVTTLDGHFARHGGRPVAFIKCDVEGHELQVFQGGRGILAEDRPDLLFECHRAADPACEVFAFLAGLGYEGHCFFGSGFAPVADYAALRPRMHSKALLDFVFVPRERGLRGGNPMQSSKREDHT